MPKFIAFLALSASLAYLSRASLRVPRCHGFFRFFAWELILGLIFLNFRGLGQWFRDPFSPRQLVSWVLLVGSLVAGVPGIRQLHSLGKPGPKRRGDIPLIGVERTTQLVTSGVFRYIRHPLYCSLLLLTWGVFLNDPTWLGSCLAASATTLLVATARVEEMENAHHFGAAYTQYMRQSKMFIPFLL